MSFDRDDATFLVLVNHEEQYSIWPDYKPVPGGWRAAGFSGNKQACLDHIEQVWTDMRPLSLRRHMAEQAQVITQETEQAGAGA
ncbi:MULTISPECIES: MbtH family protein [Cupriavidus]